MLNLILLGFAGFCFGVLTAAGVFTVLTAVGLVPRFVGETHSANEVILYENLIIAGTIVGGVFSVFSDIWTVGAGAQNRMPTGFVLILAYVFLGIAGLFAGMFVGCLALAIAEMLDSIPIFTRSISFRHGLGCMILSIALGKVCGSLLFFLRSIGVE